MRTDVVSNGVQAAIRFMLVGALCTIARADVAPATQPESTQLEVSPPAASQPAEEVVQLKPAEVVLHQLLTNSKLTGDWLGVRTQLQDLGFTFQPVLISGYMQNFRGGANTHNASDFPGMAQYNMEFDFDKKKIIPGGSFFIRGISTWGDGIKSDVGSLSQPYYVWGNSGDHSILVDKWWYRQRLLNDRIELRVGKLLNIVDLFDMNAYAGNMFSQFSNSSLTANATVPVSKGLGAFAKVWPLDWFYFQAGAMDADQKLTTTGFDTAFHGPAHFRGYWETGLTPKFDTPKGKMPGNYRLGWWYDPQTKTYFKKTPDPAILPDTESGDMGLYLNFDQMVWKERCDPKDKQGLGLFGRFGVADGDVNKIAHFWSVGGQYEGLLPTRDHDVLGFGVASSILSNHYRRELLPDAHAETVYELYYAAEVLPWLIISPDFQMITDPGGRRSATNSLVGGVRIKINL